MAVLHEDKFTKNKGLNSLNDFIWFMESIIALKVYIPSSSKFIERCFKKDRDYITYYSRVSIRSKDCASNKLKSKKLTNLLMDFRKVSTKPKQFKLFGDEIWLLYEPHGTKKEFFTNGNCLRIKKNLKSHLKTIGEARNGRVNKILGIIINDTRKKYTLKFENGELRTYYKEFISEEQVNYVKIQSYNNDKVPRTYFNNKKDCITKLNSFHAKGYKEVNFFN